MRISTEEPKGHCQLYIHDYDCADHVINHTDCSKCTLRHRVFVDLDELAPDDAELDPEQLALIRGLTRYYTR